MITLLLMENSDIINSYEDREILYDIKLNLRLLRKRFNRFMKKRSKKIFTDILIVTAGEKPVDFIQAVKKQYPDKNFSLMVPVIGSAPDTASKTGADFEYFSKIKNIPLNYISMLLTKIILKRMAFIRNLFLFHLTI